MFFLFIFLQVFFLFRYFISLFFLLIFEKEATNKELSYDEGITNEERKKNLI